MHITNSFKKICLRILLYILFLLFISLFIVSFIQIITYFKNSYKNSIVLNDIKKNIVVEKKEDNNLKNDNTYNINFDNLKKQNEDTVGFLKVNGIDLETIVVKTKDNNYYLTHNFEKQRNKSGWIFMDYRNRLDSRDKNIIIYGHNMRNGTMFASLKNILDNSWLENTENHSIIFKTEDKRTIYKVFSVYQIEKEDYYLKTDFRDSEFNTFINTLKERSIYNFDIDVTENDNVLTLTTCANNNKYRVVLHAKEIVK